MRHRVPALLLCLALALACEREAATGPATRAVLSPPTAHTPLAVTSADTRPIPDRAAPNVLLITLDTTRADRLGAYGYALDTSPSIDALARKGVVFERAIAAASVTAPSHASIFTSKYTREHSVGWMNGTTRLDRQISMAELFASAGYATGGFVGNLLLQRRLGFDRGFQTYDDDLPVQEVNRHVFERKAEQTTRKAMAWLAAQGQRPVFLWVHLQDPHGPYTPPAAYAERLTVPARPDEKPLPFIDTEFGLSGIPPYQQVDGQHLPSEYESRYAREILYADHWVGELLAAFEAKSAQQGRERMVLLTSDHGESMGEGYRYFVHGHTTTPEVAHVPMILVAPGIPPGRRDGVVNHVDIMPTLLELAGIDSPNPMSGIALGPYLRSGRALPDRLVFCDIGRELSAYRSDAFLRVKGVAGAWPVDGREVRDGPERAKAWKMYSWSEDGHWKRSPIDASLKARVRAYADTAVPMSDAPPLVVDDIERLRALGYVVGGDS